ncbi:hypothetical protein COM49_11060 [Bacillus pseudomycoides]|nr:hypothetical protein COO06_12660 [Bacillus pseudomycoides]PGD99753.1 hypothetical protein COM50_07480 [Bacillus pseudomycoides]PGE03702.1 hypothetical protein COM49_11060 [Bacillus pseudomycoides]PHE70751.1 hypothetical protein COF69_06120 [Bacillus pseudomycoides]PHG24435.1 hypothetical protein COI47_08215 [Bacillus pseudomycoides]
MSTKADPPGEAGVAAFWKVMQAVSTTGMPVGTHITRVKCWKPDCGAGEDGTMCGISSAIISAIVGGQS